MSIGQNLKNLTLKGLLVSLVIPGALISVGHADKMDLDTHTLLITKLERVLEVMEPTSEKRSDIMLRLADLHSERARLEELEQGKLNADKPSQPAIDDRKRSLTLYQDAIAAASPGDRGKIIFQMAQLYDLNGEYQKSLALYVKISQNKDGSFEPQFVGEALTKLGDISFSKIKFDEARKYFNKALDIKETPRKDYIKYRLAWCDFHSGDVPQASSHLLKTLQTSTEMEGSFREEASHDLATFLARGHVGPKEVQALSDVTPPEIRHQNLIYLSDELNRLGKKNEALYVITVAGPERDSTTGRELDESRDKIEEHLKLAEIQYDIGKKDQTIEELQKMTDQWKAESCKVSENCEILRERFKRLVVGWGKAEEKHPSSNLFKAYVFYNSLFSEAEMNYWAALAARQNSLWLEAAQSYRKASELALEERKSQVISKNQGPDKLKNIFEGSLLGEIEVAELSHNSNLRGQAYSHYIEVNPNGAKRFEVAYQQAHLLYEGGQYSEAAKEFHGLALNSGGPRNLANKAAHLSLDALVLAKEENLVDSWAKEYSLHFHEDRRAFVTIAKKAIMNRVARIIEDPNSTQILYREALLNLASYPYSEADRQEKVAYFKNRLLLAEKLQDLQECQRAIDGLLQIKDLSPVEKTYALSRLEWVDELELKFKEAYDLAQRIPLSGISAEEKYLKLAMLAELSGNSPVKHYIDYLKVTSNREKSLPVIAKLIRYTDSEKVFLEYEQRLLSNPDLLSTLALEIFSNHSDFKFAEHVLKKDGVSNTSSGKILSRFVFLENYHRFSEELVQLHLNRHGQIKKNLDQYLSVLKHAETLVERAVASQDWVLQVITLSDVAYHYKRFAVELFEMRVPEAYRNNVVFQARQYRAKGVEVSQKVTDLWKDSSIRETLFQDYSHSRGALRRSLFEELRLVAKVAPREERAGFIQAVARAEQKPAPNLERAARISVSQNPFDADKIQNLRSLEEKEGRETLVAFLDARLVQIQSGRKQ